MNKKGFTLVELILTILVMGIIAVVSAQVLMRGIDTYSLITSRKDALQRARMSMDRMTDELALVNSARLTAIGDTSISFTDALGAASDFRMVVTQTGQQLFRGSDFLSSGIGLIDFDFYQSNGGAAIVPANARRINIELTIQTVGGYGSIPLRAEVFPRNFMYTNFR